MKIRKFFVSNSSSSSFVVAFPEKIESKEKLKEMLFGEDEFYPHPYADVYGIDGYTASDVVDEVMKQVGEPLQDCEVVIEVSGGWIKEHPDFPYTGNYSEENWKEYDKMVRKINVEVSTRFVQENKSSVLYAFEFEDDTAMGAALEKGDLFDHLPHIYISKH